MTTQSNCLESVTGIHGLADRQGLCPWCKKKVDSKTPRPSVEHVRSDLDEAYDMMWDPDYGLPR